MRNAMVMRTLLSCMTAWKVQGLDPAIDLETIDCAPAAAPGPGHL